MTLQQKIAAILDGPVFGGELYYIQHPDPDGKAASVSNTYGVFTIIGGPSFQDLEGDVNISRPRVQASIYSTSSKDLVAKVAAVNAAMQAANDLTDTEDPTTNPLALNNYSSSVPVDGFEPETRRFFSHMDFNCWQSQ